MRKFFLRQFFHVEGFFCRGFVKNDAFDDKKYKKALDELDSL